VEKADYKVKKTDYKVKRGNMKEKADSKVLLYSPPLLKKAKKEEKKRQIYNLTFRGIYYTPLFMTFL
jgi:hypothetical protein